MTSKTVSIGAVLLLAGALLAGCPSQPVLKVSSTSHHFGVVEDAYETAWSFEVWNGSNSAAPLVFSVASSEPWLTATPATGESTGRDDKITIDVTIDRDYSALTKAVPEFYAGIVTVTSDVGSVAVKVTTAPDYFTEEFDGGVNIADRTFTFEPDESLSFYRATQSEAPGFPEDPAPGAILDFAQGDPVEVLPWYGKQLPFYGVDYGAFYVSSSGVVGFGEPGGSETLADHFATPQIVGLSTVDATAGGLVSVLQTAEKLVVTYEDVPTAAKTLDSNNFQVEMFFDGTIRLTYLGVDADSGIAGLSYGPGDGVPGDFLPSDFTDYSTGPLKAAY